MGIPREASGYAPALHYRLGSTRSIVGAAPRGRAQKLVQIF